MYDFTINYPNCYGLLPTSNPTKFVGTREKNGAIQEVAVTVTQSAPSVIGNMESVTIKVETTILTSNQP